MMQGESEGGREGQDGGGIVTGVTLSTKASWLEKVRMHIWGQTWSNTLGT